jgi:superfamily II RNA helicase
MNYRGFELDRFQIEAINALNDNKSVLVAAPTGTGKTIIADYVVELALQEEQEVIYTAPIKALSNQKFRDYTRLYGDERVGLVTGDLVIRRDAPCRVMTTEILRNMLLNGDDMSKLKAVIIDEVHFLDDPERGTVWEEVLIYLPKDVLIVALSATLPNLHELADWLTEVREREVVVVTEDKRSVPLQIHYANTETGILSRDEYEERFNQRPREEPRESNNRRNSGKRRGDSRRSNARKRGPVTQHHHLFRMMSRRDLLPYLYFAFSRKNCERFAWSLRRDTQTSLLTQDEQMKMAEILIDASTEVGPALSQDLRGLYSMGIAFHHAGLHVHLKALVESLYEQRLIKVLYCTSTFALGLNMPARSVVFDAIEKYDGKTVKPLTMRQFMQKAGRAGRRGLDDVGHVVIRLDFADYKNLRPALTRYREGTYEPVRSSFSLSFNSVVNLLKNHSMDDIRELIGKSFLSWRHDRIAESQRQQANSLAKKLGTNANRRQQRNVRRLEKSASSSAARSWQSFERKVQFLQYIGYLSDERDFNAGANFLGHIQIAEIFVTEIFLEGLFEGLDDALLYGVLVGIVMQLPRNTRCGIKLPRDSRTPLQSIERILRTEAVQVSADLSGQEVAFDLDAVALGYSWAKGDTLDEILHNMDSQTDVSGSVVSGFRRAKDLATQLRYAAGPLMPDTQAQFRRIARQVTRDEVMVVG